ncbi:response regulator transcription factor [Zafaria sp. Z1313]|uniref:response regulator transcription factor n=1 Tax=unclassified Zafaria TaxID=2828765 RepID=UPI002E7A6942|nr:response regulator transcription factor [Zafaria sp. J156]MEE1620504.1 response regulator transcription factor [Zafaria sp. J156]
MDERRVAVVVEDDEDIRGLLEAVLQSSGFEVHPASTGLEGVELAAAQSPDLVTLDLGLPDIDGFEVARRIRRGSDAHIVMLTARTDEIDTVLGLEMGADDYLTKPFSPRELRARVDAIMRRRTAAADDAPVPTSTVATEGSVATASAAPSAAPVAPVVGASVDVAEGSALQLNGLVLQPALYRVDREGTEVQLTPTEFLLLQTILERGRVVSSKADLVRRLRDEDHDAGTFVSGSDERSIEVHLGNLRRKLGDDAREPRWVETVRGIGYRAALPR